LKSRTFWIALGQILSAVGGFLQGFDYAILQAMFGGGLLTSRFSKKAGATLAVCMLSVVLMGASCEGFTKHPDGSDKSTPEIVEDTSEIVEDVGEGMEAAAPFVPAPIGTFLAIGGHILSVLGAAGAQVAQSLGKKKGESPVPAVGER
jgi:hypothetical protein